MIVALTRWETIATPAVAVEPIEHQAIAEQNPNGLAPDTMV
jgi:hypothetical protein